MEQNLEQPSILFQSEKVKFELAKEEYRKAIRKLKPLAEFNNFPAPPVNRAAYSDRMAWTLANMAKLAYIPFEESGLGMEQLEYSLQSGWFNLMKTFNKKGTQAFLAKNDEFAVLAFRGTQPTRWEDVRTDLRALKQKTIEGKVHKGFKEAFDDVRDEIFDIVRKSIGKDLPLYITGHSLGAALATVATQELEEEFEDLIAACYTFGSPRVGDGTYEKSIKVPFYRIVNTTDIVTMVPIFLGTFVHVGDPRYLSRRKIAGVYRIYRGIPNLRRILESILETLLALVRLKNPIGPWIGAHDMTIYIEKLGSYAKARNVEVKD
jgi:triacylglycerol lipase